MSSSSSNAITSNTGTSTSSSNIASNGNSTAVITEAGWAVIEREANFASLCSALCEQLVTETLPRRADWGVQCLPSRACLDISRRAARRIWPEWQAVVRTGSAETAQAFEVFLAYPTRRFKFSQLLSRYVETELARQREGKL